MKFIRTNIPDVVIIEPDVYSDSRGYFFEAFRKDELDNYLGYSVKFCQDNESKSFKGVLRGLHYQAYPYSQTKLVRVIHGSVFDVAVDIRKGSPTFGKYVGVELSATNKRQLIIPIGFAHGFVVLEDDTIFSYKVDNYYNPKYERGISFNDKSLNIDWKVSLSELILSKKDQEYCGIKNNNDLFEYGVNYYV